MKEFHWWVAIVTLLLFLNLLTWMGLLYMDKRLKRTEVICLRAEHVDKEKKNDRRKKDVDKE